MQQLLGVVVGGLLTLLGAILNSRIQEERLSKREARSLARAFRGEILALREIVQRRKYSEAISTAIETMRRTGQPYDLRIPIRRGYFAIFNNNVAKLGMLEGMLPETIATFYVQANSILEDITSINEGLFAGNVPGLMQVYEELGALLSDSSGLALRIADEVLLLYP